MSGIALDLSRFEVDFLRNLPPAERIRQEKRQVKHGRCPDQASVNPNRLRGKEPMIGKEVSLKHLRYE